MRSMLLIEYYAVWPGYLTLFLGCFPFDGLDRRPLDLVIQTAAARDRCANRPRISNFNFTRVFFIDLKI